MLRSSSDFVCRLIPRPPESTFLLISNPWPVAKDGRRVDKRRISNVRLSLSHIISPWRNSLIASYGRRRWDPLWLTPVRRPSFHYGRRGQTYLSTRSAGASVTSRSAHPTSPLSCLQRSLWWRRSWWNAHWLATLSIRSPSPDMHCTRPKKKKRNRLRNPPLHFFKCDYCVIST